MDSAASLLGADRYRKPQQARRRDAASSVTRNAPAVHGPMSGLLSHDPADGVVLQLDVLRIPQIGEHVARRHIADPALTIVVRPASRSRGAVVLISKSVFVHGLQEEELGVLVVNHVVLLVGD